MDKDRLAWLFFQLSGRVSRAAYFLAGILLAIIQGFLLYRFTLAPEQSTISEILALAFWAVVVVSFWSNFALGVKRLHDFGQPGVIAVSLFVPVLSIIAFIALCFIPGDAGPNSYGAKTNLRA